MAGRMLIPTLIVAVPLVAGCSESDYAAVRGQVFYNDQPLSQGVVMFQPANGPPARGAIQPDGTFELEMLGNGKGARIGTNRVRISAREEPKNQYGEIGLGRRLIPARYDDITTSGLTAEVNPENNEPFVFRLTD